MGLKTFSCHQNHTAAGGRRPPTAAATRLLDQFPRNSEVGSADRAVDDAMIARERDALTMTPRSCRWCPLIGFFTILPIARIAT